MKTKNKSANIMRWVARIFGVVLVVFTLIMVIGEFLESKERHHGVSPLNEYTPLIIAIFIVWGLGLVGLLIGWWKAKLGGFLSLICFFLVAILNLFNAESPMQAGAFFCNGDLLHSFTIIYSILARNKVLITQRCIVF